jgi:hypothetical protein
MNKLQKIAWFNLKVVAVGGSVSLLMIAVSLAVGGLVITYLAFLALGVTALIMALSPLLVGKEPGRVTFDERDAAIEKKAHYVGYHILWCIFIVTCLIAVPTAGFAILATSLVTVQLVESAATLVQYGWRGKENE